jgi:quercetin dioxygenase-like cupin family protein
LFLLINHKQITGTMKNSAPLAANATLVKPLTKEAPAVTTFYSRLGEIFRITKPASQTNGKYIEVEVELQPNPHHRPLHYHPQQSEHFLVQEGTLQLQINREVKTMIKGEEITILPGTPHSYWNNSTDKVMVKTTLSPALNFQEFLAVITKLEATVATDNQGVPVNKFLAAQLLNQFKHIIIPSDIPKLILNLVFPLMALAGKLANLRLPVLLFVAVFSLILLSPAAGQSRFPKHEININGFRNPSIGLKYRYRFVSVHAGHYVTNFESNVTTRFYKTGLSFWFLPIGRQPNPSSFYTQLSYLRGQNREYQMTNAGAVDVGFRWMVWWGLNLRLGVTALLAPGKEVQINPTPGIGYAISL